MAAPPLSHHEIIGLVEPYTRRGRHVDLGASQRAERRLAFKPVEHGDTTPELPGLRETLQLDNLRPGRWRLTRTLALPQGPQPGLQATLQAEGSEPGELLARIEAIAPQRQFGAGPGYTLARSYRLEAGSDAAAHLILTRAAARLDGLAVALQVSSVRGIAGEIELTPLPQDAAGRLCDLPEDLLAVLGWSWARLQRAKEGWTCVLRLRGSDAVRSADAQAKFDTTVQHLARTLAEPPRRFHERLAGARWKVTLRRAVPMLITLALIVGAAGVPRLALAQDSVLRMLIFHSPPLLLMLFFCLREMPRIEFPPLPRPSQAPSWLAPETAP